MNRTERLYRAIIATETPCEDDSRFVMDRISRSDEVQLQAICAECPVLATCAEYAERTRPVAGVWAGVKHDRWTFLEADENAPFTGGPTSEVPAP